MEGTRLLHDLGQSIWLDNITRDLLTSGTLDSYIKNMWVTGLTSNPTIFDQAISKGDAYDADIRRLSAEGLTPEQVFFELALADLRAAADLFEPIHVDTDGVDGWVSLEVSPLLAHDTASTVAEATSLHGRTGRDNVFIKIPGTAEGIPAIEEAIYAGVPVNVTLLFSAQQYVAAAEAYLRGIERRVSECPDPRVRSVASLFVSRWDKATMGKVPGDLQNTLGIAVAEQTYVAYRDLLETERWKKLRRIGIWPQRLLFASTGTKDPNASDVLYAAALAAPDTINTMPETTLFAFADHGKVERTLPRDGGDSREVLSRFAAAGVDVDDLAARLQDEGAEAFVASWQDLLQTIASRAASGVSAGGDAGNNRASGKS